tara:strand:+ start:194 stop:430 length:237 start_codon:yes stop_codon:yes gene_type:complete
VLDVDNKPIWCIKCGRHDIEVTEYYEDLVIKRCGFAVYKTPDGLIAKWDDTDEVVLDTGKVSLSRYKTAVKLLGELNG